jgi:thioredoxin 1
MIGKAAAQPKAFYPVSKSFFSTKADMIEMKDSADWDGYLESDTPIIL